MKNTMVFILVSLVFYLSTDGMCGGLAVCVNGSLCDGSWIENEKRWFPKNGICPEWQVPCIEWHGVLALQKKGGSTGHGFFSLLRGAERSFLQNLQLVEGKENRVSFSSLYSRKYGASFFLIVFSSFLVLCLVWWNRKLSLAKRETAHVLSQLHHTQMLLSKKNDVLENLVTMDSLTGIYSRGKLEEILEYEIARSRRYDTPFGIVFLNVDYFAQVVEKYGCYGGDILLQEIADLLQQNIRRVDVVGRWSGDVFLIVCPSGTVDGLFRLSEHLRCLIEQNDFTVTGHGTASFGFALFEEDDEVATMIARADRGVSRAKFFGKNRVGMAAI